ncbi:Dual specificity protein phosphatase 1 [Diplonema papillatum]|nr:Dual specificity protein phosphatase 1 [Diplonema papillatum]|eukprot:gene8130-12503_t
MNREAKSLHAFIEEVANGSRLGIDADKELARLREETAGAEDSDTTFEDVVNKREQRLDHEHTPLTYCVRLMFENPRSGELEKVLQTLLTTPEIDVIKPGICTATTSQWSPLVFAEKLNLVKAASLIRTERENRGLTTIDLSMAAAGKWLTKLHEVLKRDFTQESLGRPARLLRNLYLGDLQMAFDATPPKITAVLNCCASVQDNTVLHQKRGQQYHQFAAQDADEYPLLDMHFEAACDFLDNAIKEGHTVLVHCVAGINRSAAICAAYLMRRHRMKLIEAVRHVHEQRPIILSNQSFRDQLVCFAFKENLLA